MNHFVFIVPMYNAAKTLPRMLHSVCAQGYEDWQIILLDDLSNEENKEACRKILASFNLLDNNNLTKIKVIWNTSKKWEVSNVLTGINMCQADDIICRLDADDYLVDLDALEILNRVYEQNDVQAVWTAHRWNATDRNISTHMPPTADPYKHPWVSSHLKTFRKSLITGVSFENFLNMNGEIVRRAGDQAIYLPVLHNAGAKRGYLARVFYHYTIDEDEGRIYQTDDAKFQKQEADFIRERGYVTHGITWETKF